MTDWREPIKVIAELLANQMDLSADRIFIYNDGRPLPKDDGLYLVISINGTEPFRNTSKFTKKVVNGVETFTDEIDINFKQNIIVSVISKDSSARLRAYEVTGALSSIYSQQLQEKYACHIAKIGRVTDASFLEKTDMLTRMDVSISVLSWKKIVKDVDYMTVSDVDSLFEA